MRYIIFVFLLFTNFNAPTQLQQTRELKGKVFAIGENGKKIPETNLIVSIEETGNSDDSNDLGVFRIALPENYKAGETVKLAIDKPNWRIRYPLDGEARIPFDLQKEIVEVELLPIGSKLFWTHDRIEKFVSGLAERSREQIKKDGKPEEIDFSRYIKDWAEQYGFSAKQAKFEIDKWIEEIEKKYDDLYQLGLAAFAKKKFGEASKLFHDSALHQTNQLDEVERQIQTLEERERSITQKIVRDFRLEGDSHYSNYQFGFALTAYQRALQYVTRKQSPRSWATIKNKIGDTHKELGIRVEGDSIEYHLQSAVDTFQEVLTISTHQHFPEEWAGTQQKLGDALRELGIRTKGGEGNNLLDDALNAYNLALEIKSREDHHREWAQLQFNLGTALYYQGIRIGGSEGAGLLSKALQAYHSALNVYDNEEHSRDWALIQCNLGITLEVLGQQRGGTEGLHLLGEAIEAFKLALEIYTREAVPQEWARIQSHLALALQDQSLLTSGIKREHLLSEAEQAFRSALEIYTRETLPQNWALTQINLGDLLVQRGSQIDGAEGVRLLDEAMRTLRLASEVFTREDFSLYWAGIQGILGKALCEQAIHVDGAEGIPFLDQSMELHRLVLEVFTREDYPQYWAMTQQNLAVTLREKGIRISGGEGKQLLEEAVTAFHLALEVRTSEHFPVQWAETQKALAQTYDALEDWQNAADCYAEILKVSPDDKDTYTSVVHVFHERLFDFSKAFELSQFWLKQHPDDLSAQSDFAEKHFTTGRFVECEARISTLLASSEVDKGVKIALRTIGIANSLALRKPRRITAQLDSLQVGIKAQAEDFKINWAFDGTKHFISTDKELTPYRAWLLHLFEAVELEGREQTLDALRAVREKFHK